MTPCNHWTGRVRCDRVADVTLHDPDGDMVPGGFYCRPHAEACVTEYREKLGEQWSVKSLDDYDPTPWCSWCGAKRRQDCDCGPMAEND
jgi:hypothetical protein